MSKTSRESKLLDVVARAVMNFAGEVDKVSIKKYWDAWNEELADPGCIRWGLPKALEGVDLSEYEIPNGSMPLCRVYDSGKVEILAYVEPKLSDKPKCSECADTGRAWDNGDMQDCLCRDVPKVPDFTDEEVEEIAANLWGVFNMKGAHHAWEYTQPINRNRMMSVAREVLRRHHEAVSLYVDRWLAVEKDKDEAIARAEKAERDLSDAEKYTDELLKRAQKAEKTLSEYPAGPDSARQQDELCCEAGAALREHKVRWDDGESMCDVLLRVISGHNHNITLEQGEVDKYKRGMGQKCDHYAIERDNATLRAAEFETLYNGEVNLRKGEVKELNEARVCLEIFEKSAKLNCDTMENLAEERDDAIARAEKVEAQLNGFRQILNRGDDG